MFLLLARAVAWAAPLAVLAVERPDASIDLDADGVPEALRVEALRGAPGPMALRVDGVELHAVAACGGPTACAWTVEDLDADGRVDVVATVRRDVGEEVTYLLNDGEGVFRVLRMGLWPPETSHRRLFPMTPADAERDAEAGGAVARWDAKERRFTGTRARWISGEAVRLRSAPSMDGKVARLLRSGDVVTLLAMGDPAFLDGEVHRWMQVARDDTRGWVWGRYVALHPPERQVRLDGAPPPPAPGIVE